MTDRVRVMLVAALALTVLTACNRVSQAPGMDAKDLSDDRGARAGRFRSPPANGADNAADPGADNATTAEGNQ